MHTFSRLICLLAVLSISACAAPKRGDPEFAPSLPYRAQLPEHSDAIYQQGTAMLFMEDLKARRIGDTLTVTLEEQTDAQKHAETGTSKLTDAEIANLVLMGKSATNNGNALFEASLGSEHAFDGAGESSQGNTLRGNITVSVVNVLANGNLVVQGEKWITINQGQEYVRLRGIVRPSDIRQDNSVSSVRVADAQIQYSGDDVLNDANSMGWLARFFNSKWMPF